MHRVASTLLLITALVSLPLALGCGGSDIRAPFPDVTVTDRSADDLELAPLEEPATAGGDAAGAAPADAAGADAPPPEADASLSSGPPLVVVGESTPIAGPTPTLRVTAPTSGATIRSGAVTVRFQLRDWELASPAGPHVHLILDNEPYVALRDASAPVDLAAVVGHPIAEGTHVLRLFPSRGHHESVKDAGAFAVVVFHYGHATEGFSFDPAAPLLTYSRPKGCNVAGERVLVDFFVSNATLAPDGHHVRWTLDGRTGDITTWAPHWIDGLSAGSHELRLVLVGPDGAPVPGVFNDTTRTFTVAATCG